MMLPLVLVMIMGMRVDLGHLADLDPLIEVTPSACW